MLELLGHLGLEQVALIGTSRGGLIAMVLAGLSARLLGIGVHRMAFRLRDVRDEDGTLVSLRVSYWDKFSFREDLASEPVFQDLVDSGSKARIGGAIAEIGAWAEYWSNDLKKSTDHCGP